MIYLRIKSPNIYWNKWLLSKWLLIFIGINDSKHACLVYNDE